MPAEAVRLTPNDAAFGVVRSFTGRRWILRDAPDAATRELTLHGGLSPLLARLLAARGVGAGEVDTILNPTLKQLLPEPLILKDMDKAVSRLKRAIECGERIAVFGDYDVDGSTSAALMSEFLSAVGPCRAFSTSPTGMTEGYGPNPNRIPRDAERTKAPCGRRHCRLRRRGHGRA